jgi:hypothetical protein
MEITGKHTFTPLNKVSLPQRRFSQNSRSLDTFL